MAENPLDRIIRQPTTKTMNIMTKQMAKMVSAVKTTKWRGKQRSLPLILGGDDYITVTRDATETIHRLSKPAPVNEDITTFSTPFKILTLQESKNAKKGAYKLQEAATEIRVEQIIECIKEKYTEELNKEYFGFSNSTIITMTTYLRATWCKVLTRDKTEAKEDFLQPWTLPAQIISFRSYLNKHHK